jgi:hypothetical protein
MTEGSEDGLLRPKPKEYGLNVALSALVKVRLEDTGIFVAQGLPELPLGRNVLDSFAGLAADVVGIEDHRHAELEAESLELLEHDVALHRFLLRSSDSV